jgi:MoaA/NifB/PqqE/SkfB family radical SAM enzyme
VEPYAVEISLHGATAETHDRQTRVAGSFHRLTGNIAKATAAGLRVQGVTTPTAWNQHEVAEMWALCDSLDIPLRFQGPVAPRDNGDPAPLTIQPGNEVWRVIERESLRRGFTGSGIIAGDGDTARPAQTGQGDGPTPATCSVGVAGVDIDPFGNVLACMHLQEAAGSLHQDSIARIWDESPLFQRARARAVSAAEGFRDSAPSQLGAPLYCLAVEENLNKGCGGESCTVACPSSAH